MNCTGRREHDGSDEHQRRVIIALDFALRLFFCVLFEWLTEWRVVPGRLIQAFSQRNPTESQQQGQDHSQGCAPGRNHSGSQTETSDHSVESFGQHEKSNERRYLVQEQAASCSPHFVMTLDCKRRYCQGQRQTWWAQNWRPIIRLLRQKHGVNRAGMPLDLHH
jgi:hypothetical protein